MDSYLTNFFSMVFHTAMIVLHRPPHHTLNQPGIDESEDVQICYESLQAILRLFRSYSRYYKYSALPLVRTLTAVSLSLAGHENRSRGCGWNVAEYADPV